MINFFWPKIVIFFLPNIQNLSLGHSKELYHWEGSFEYPQHTFWLNIKKINFQLLMPGFVY